MGQYIIFPSSDVCQTCPRGINALKSSLKLEKSLTLLTYAGATCPDGSKFLPVVNGSKWGVEKPSDGIHLYRLIGCPPGYVISRDDLFPDQDRCVQCSTGTYSLIFAESTAVKCQACPVGGICSGGDIVQSTDGFWRRDVEVLTVVAVSAEIYKCPIGNFTLSFSIFHYFRT